MTDADPFASAGEEDDPFADAPAVGAYPTPEQLRGHLLLIKPTKLEENILSARFSKPGKPVYNDRITADVYVVDGSPKGFEGETEFMDMYWSGDRMVKQLKRNVGGVMVLGRLQTYKEGVEAGPGNPWGLLVATPEDKGMARTFWKARSQPKTAPNPFAQ